MNADDIRMVVVGPDGTWLSARVGDGTKAPLSGQEAAELQREIESKGGLNGDTAVGVARNPKSMPQPSAETGMPWIPMPRRKKRKR